MRQLLMVLALFVGAVAPAQKSDVHMPWMHSIDAALAEAKAKNKPVIVCFNMDNERANDAMVKNHYVDPAVVGKAGEFVCLIASKFEHNEELSKECPRFKTVTCAEHIAIEKFCRETYLASSTVNSPQHLFLKPDGTMHSTKVWYLTNAELIELMDGVLRSIFPERYKTAEPEPTKPAVPSVPEAPKAEAPKLKKDPKTPEEIRTAVLEATDVYEIRGYARKLAKSEVPEERLLVPQWLAEEAFTKKRPGLLLSLGFKGNKEAVAVVVPFLSSKDKDERAHAAVALEDIADKSALKPLKKQLDVEKDEYAKKEIVRALGTCAENDTATTQLLLDLATDESRELRINALLALGNLKKNDKIEKELIATAFSTRGWGGGRGGARGGNGGGDGRGGRGGDNGGGGNRGGRDGEGGGRGGDGGNGGGMGGFGDWQRSPIAAASFSLAKIRSKKAKEEAEKRLQSSDNPWITGMLEGFVKLYDLDFTGADPEVARRRATIGGDKIRRDLDPEPAPPGEGEGPRPGADRGGEKE